MISIMCKNCFLDKLQRFLLLFSALFILFVIITSSSISHVYPKIFFATALLLIGLNPKKWLQKKAIIEKTQPLFQCKTQTSQQIEDVKEIEEVKESHSPIGFLTQDKMIFLKSFMKLRSAEVASLYKTIREFQENSPNESWIFLFLQHFALHHMNDEQRAKEQAASLYKKNYQFDSQKPIKSYEIPLTNLHIALIYWNKGPKFIIQRLEEFLAFGFLEEKIEALINAYHQIDLVSNEGSFRSIFAKSNAKEFKRCLDEISRQWDELARLLKISILLTKVKDDVDNAQKSKIDLYLKEISALAHLYSNFHMVIMQPDSKRQNSFHDEENFFFKHLKYNPIWYHYFSR